MADAASAWSHEAEAYQRIAEVSEGITRTYREFAQDVAARLKQTEYGTTYKVLDIASAHGQPGFSLASELPGVDLTVTDIAPGMLKLAEAEAQRQGLTTVSFKVANGEDLSAWPDNTFDAVMCSFALFLMDSERALKEWKRVLKPHGYLAFSMWDFQQHQLMGVGFTVIQRITPGRRSPVLPQTAQDLGKQEPGLKVLQRLGFQNEKCRESNVPLHIPASHLNDLMANPMMSSWIASNSAEGPEREAFYQKAFQTFIDIAKERSYMLEDGSFCAPTHTMLYFTASKP